MKRLMFFEFHHSKQHFIDCVIPNIKHSLSLALQRFYPFAGRLRGSRRGDSIEPHIFCSDGDSVSLIVAESDSDFKCLTGGDPCEISEFKSLAPGLDCRSSLMAIQVTLFRNQLSNGISIGITFNHVVADGKSFSQFIKFWASICKVGSVEAENVLISESSSSVLFDRTIVRDPKGILGIHLNQLSEFEKLLKPIQNPHPVEPIAQINDRVRTKFVMGRTQIQKLKQWFTKKIDEKTNTNPSPSSPDSSIHLSSFVVVCACFWVCLIKSRKYEDSKTWSTTETECLVFAVDCRDRLNPPLPESYFGNCITHCATKADNRDLIEEDGIVVAAEAIGREVQRLSKENRVMEIAETSLADLCSLMGSGAKVLSVAGSPKFKVYESDFGWGRPRKVEVVSIEDSGAMSLFENRDEENGGVEVGLVLRKLEMDTFASLFGATLKALI